MKAFKFAKSIKFLLHAIYGYDFFTKVIYSISTIL